VQAGLPALEAGPSPVVSSELRVNRRALRWTRARRAATRQTQAAAVAAWSASVRTHLSSLASTGYPRFWLGQLWGAAVIAATRAPTLAPGGAGGAASTSAIGTGGTRITGTKATGGASSVAGATSTSLSCASCGHTKCATQLSDCIGNTDCVAILTCAFPCATTDTACIDNCATNNPNGQTGWNALSACAATNCAGCS
jgi:hypothetical protein